MLLMLSKNTKAYSVILITADFLVLLIAFTIAYVVRVQIDHRPLVNPVFAFDYLLTALAILPLWILVFASLTLYRTQTYNRRLVEWGRVFIGCLIGVLVVIGWEYLTGKIFFPARLVALYAFGAAFLLIVLERELMRLVRSLAYRYGIGISRVLIIGETAATEDIAQALAITGQSGYHVVAMATPKKYVPYRRGITHYADIESALKSVEAHHIDAIIQTDLSPIDEVNERILATAQIHHIRYSFIPGAPEFYTGKNTVDVFLGYPMISVYQTPLVGWGELAKRIFDVVLVSLMAPLWVPLMALIVILQKLLNPGKVVFSQVRLTKNGREFKLYKFRSMIPEYSGRDDIEVFTAMGRPDLVKEFNRDFKVAKDPRISPFGNFLRKTSLDELPQIINVLRGELSLVGPRPLRPHEVKAKYSQVRGALLHEVRGGLTGLWQVSGRSDTTDEQRIELELYYVQNWSFALDLKILFKTIKVVLLRSGAR